MMTSQVQITWPQCSRSRSSSSTEYVVNQLEVGAGFGEEEEEGICIVTEMAGKALLRLPLFPHSAGSSNRFPLSLLPLPQSSHVLATDGVMWSQWNATDTEGCSVYTVVTAPWGPNWSIINYNLVSFLCRVKIIRDFKGSSVLYT